MDPYNLSRLSDRALLCGAVAVVAQERNTTATLLAHLAEIDSRKLYLPAGYSSMFAYCVGELGLYEQAAFKRIHAARAARRFPAIFAAVADGRLHLSAVVLLAPYLTLESADGLLTSAAHQSKTGIEQLLARRFPRPDVPARIETISTASTLGGGQLSPGKVEAASASARSSVLPPMDSPTPRAKLAPLAAERFALQFTIDQDTHDMLRYAQELHSHSIPTGDLAQLFKLALEALIDRAEKRKFGATSHPRLNQPHSTSNNRHIPAHIRRAVWERDQGQCTFVSENGHRCTSRKFLEFDHIDPVARGGKATVETMRLRCRAHNQFAAECAFGTDFMRQKRLEAQRTATARRAAAEANEIDVIPWLRKLGFRADEARRAAAQCETIPDVSLEERVRRALSYLRPPHRRVMNGPADAI